MGTPGRHRKTRPKFSVQGPVSGDHSVCCFVVTAGKQTDSESWEAGQMTIKGRLAIGLVVVIATFGVAPASADANPFKKFLKVLKTHTKSILKPIDCCGGISCRRLRELEAITGDPKGAVEAGVEAISRPDLDGGSPTPPNPSGKPAQRFSGRPSSHPARWQSDAGVGAAGVGADRGVD